MAQLRLFFVDCNNQQEGNGDEIYFTFKNVGGDSTGRTNTITDMDTGERFYLTDRFDFSGSVEVKLYEQDPGLDDKIGHTVTLNFDPKDVGVNHTMVFAESGVNYDVRYDIIA